MLVIKIELWPLGDASRAETLEIGTIVNDGTGDAATGNYVVKLQKSPRFSGPKTPRPDAEGRNLWRAGVVKGFTRTLSAWELLRRALVAALVGGGA